MVCPCTRRVQENGAICLVALQTAEILGLTLWARPIGMQLLLLLPRRVRVIIE